MFRGKSYFDVENVLFCKALDNTGVSVVKNVSMKRPMGVGVLFAVCMLCMSSAMAVEEPIWITLSSAQTWQDAQPDIPLVSMRETDGGPLDLTIDLPGFWARKQWADNQEFSVLDIAGWSTLQEVGKPALPFKMFMIEIPTGSTPTVQIGVKNTVMLDGYTVMPAQPPLADVMPEPPKPDFTADPDVYDTDVPFPASNIIDSEIITLRNKRIWVLKVSPFRIQNESGQLEAAYHLEIDVDFIPDANPQSAAWQDAPVDAGDLLKYMILMDDQFEDNALVAELIDWKKRKGYDVVVVKTSEIDAGGAPTAAEVVDYMRALSDAAYPDYLLILGDHTEANGVAGTYFNSYTTNYSGFTDLDMACRTDSDYIPDLYYGRLPATDSANASNMLSKVIAMDRTPPTNDYFQNVCVAGQIQDRDDGGDNQADRLFCETADSISCYFEQDANGLDYSSYRGMVNPNSVDANCYWASGSILWNSTNQIGTRVFQHFVSVTDARNCIINNVNRGVSILQHRDHGYVSGSGWADPYFTTTYVNNYLTNGVKRPVVFSVNCNSGMYQYSGNFARAWIQHEQGGAYAIFAPVDTSYSWYNDWMTHGFYTAFLTNYTTWHNDCSTPDWPKEFPAPNGTYGNEGACNRLGQILNFGKMYMYEKYYPNETTFKLFHLLGDPESFIRIANLQALNPSYSSIITPGVQTVEITLDVADCDVCLYSEALNVHQRITTTNTTASFDISPGNTGTLYVTAYRHDRIPFEGTIQVSGAIPDYDVVITDISLSLAETYTDTAQETDATEDGRNRETRTTEVVYEKTAEDSAPIDATLTANVTIKNVTGTDMDAGMLSVWAHEGATVSAPATGDQVQTIGTLNAGESRVLTFSNLSAGDGETRRAFRAFIDCRNTTPETNEVNNQQVSFYPENPTLCTFTFSAAGRMDSANLSWVDPVSCGLSNSTVMIRWSTNGTPSGVNDGLLLYNGSDISYHHTGLVSDRTYYYRIWVSQDGQTFSDPSGGTTSASATPQANPIQVIVRSSDAVMIGGKLKSPCHVLPFRAGGSGIINTSALPATFNLATKWTMEGSGEFNPDMAGREILIRDSNGTLFLLYIQSDGSLDWSSDTNSVYWKSFAVGSTYATNASEWSVETIGDVTGNGQDEVLVRDGATFVQGGKTKTYMRVIPFDPSGGGQLASSLPDMFKLATTWTVEGAGRFNTSAPSGCSTNAMQLLLRHVSDGGFYLLYFETSGDLYWNAYDTNNLCWTSYSAGSSFSETATDWSLIGIGDINGDGQDEILMKNDNTFTEGGKTKSYYRVLFFSNAGSGCLTTEQPASFKLSTSWTAEAIGNFNICTANDSVWSDQLLLRRTADGGLFLLYFNADGTLYWDENNTSNICWTSFTPGEDYSTTPSRMSIQAFGDVMGLRE